MSCVWRLYGIFLLVFFWGTLGSCRWRSFLCLFLCHGCSCSLSVSSSVYSQQIDSWSLLSTNRDAALMYAGYTLDMMSHDPSPTSQTTDAAEQSSAWESWFFCVQWKGFVFVWNHSASVLHWVRALQLPPGSHVSQHLRVAHIDSRKTSTGGQIWFSTKMQKLFSKLTVKKTEAYLTERI